MNPVSADIILIAEGERNRAMSEIKTSTRLAHLLNFRNIQRLGDLHGLSWDHFTDCRGCGSRTLRELRGLKGVIPAAKRVFLIPPEAHELNPQDLPVSTRLGNVLKAAKIVRLGDLHGRTPRQLLGVENCGTHTLKELDVLLQRVAAGEFRPPAKLFVPPDTAEFLRLIHEAITRLPDRPRVIFQMLFAGTTAAPRTLKDAGYRFHISRERARQLATQSLVQIRRVNGPAMGGYLRWLAELCAETLCPLTPALLVQWLGESAAKLQWKPEAYVRLLGELDSEIPAWPRGQQPSQPCKSDIPISATLKSVLLNGRACLPLPEAFQQVCARLGTDKPSARDFLEMLHHTPSFAVDFPSPDHPTVRLRRVTLTEAIRTVLDASDHALTLEEILANARAHFGNERVARSMRTLEARLKTRRDFLQIDRRSYGLPKHLNLPVGLLQAAPNALYKFFKKEKRSISTGEIVSTPRFEWASQTNKYEVASLLRQDKRFVDLGRHLFGLAEWGLKQRTFIKDLVPGILARAGRPMTRQQILREVQRLRSVGTNSISTAIRHAPGVCQCGQGYYGLLSWERFPQTSAPPTP